MGDRGCQAAALSFLCGVVPKRTTLQTIGDSSKDMLRLVVQIGLCKITMC